MNRCEVLADPNQEVQITEVINKELGRRTALIFEGKTDDAIEVSDGHHTMSELYEHRYALFAALIKIYDGYITPLGATAVRCWKSKQHSDGDMFEGWFIAGMVRGNIDGTEMQISYHLPISWWDKVRCIELPRAPKWDGHTSQDVIERLAKL